MNFLPFLFRVVVISAACHGAFSAPAAAASAAGDSSLKLLKDASLMLLREGNARFVSGKAQHPNQDAERRTNTVAQGQEPFATILACSDSRDPVELIFDRGVGDLFVVRVAGNIAGISEIATVEYGVGHLHTPLLVVMGHTKCGAVTAVVKGAELHGHLPRLAEKIKPAAARAKAETASGGDAVPKAIEANVWQTIADLVRQSDAVREKIRAQAVMVVGAVYDLESGKVNWLGPHPDLRELLDAPRVTAAHGHGDSDEAEGHGEPQDDAASRAGNNAAVKFLRPAKPPVRTTIADPHDAPSPPPASAAPAGRPAAKPPAKGLPVRAREGSTSPAEHH